MSTSTFSRPARRNRARAIVITVLLLVLGGYVVLMHTSLGSGLRSTFGGSSPAPVPAPASPNVSQAPAPVPSSAQTSFSPNATTLPSPATTTTQNGPFGDAPAMPTLPGLPGLPGASTDPSVSDDPAMNGVVDRAQQVLLLATSNHLDQILVNTDNSRTQLKVQGSTAEVAALDHNNCVFRATLSVTGSVAAVTGSTTDCSAQNR